MSSRLTPKDAQAWWLAQRIANVTLAGRMLDFTQGAKFYHTVQVRPVWRMTLVETKKIGKHKFYSAG